jgi:hypothetical protein
VGLTITGTGGRIDTYICAEAENDIVKTKATKNNSLLNLFFIIEYFFCLKN